MRISNNFLLALIAAGSLAPVAEAAPVRTILHNGKVFTADPEHPWAEAVAIEDERILAVGSDNELLMRVKPGTRLVDLQGHTVVPGLNDAHVHMLAPQGAALNTAAFAPGPGPSLADMLALIDSKATDLPTDSWLLGHVGEAFFADPAADRFALDTVSPDHPVVLFAWTGHGMWLNTRAMEMLGISETMPDPFGGHWERVPDSPEITGVAHEYAEFDVRRRLLALLSDEQLVAQVQQFAQQAAQLGYTSLQDMAVGLEHQRAVDILHKADLPLRVRSICVPLDPDESCVVTKLGDDFEFPRVTVGGIKWIMDGTPVERNACVEQAYADAPGWNGVFNFDPTQVLAGATLQAADPARAQVLFHTVGDGAIGRVLDALEQTGGAQVWGDRRVRLEHADLLLTDELARAYELGVVVVQNGTHLGLPLTMMQRFAPDVFSDMQPLATLVGLDIPLALGTDGIGHVMNPFVDLMLATWHPLREDEALTLAEAVVAYTRGAAYAEFSEHDKGVLAPGMLADLAILSHDIFDPKFDKFELPGVSSLLTMVGGEVVWSAGVLLQP